jgi:hypothetical protein
LEELVAAQVLEVVTPAGLELSLRAAQEWERERAALDRQWRLRLERAAQETDRASRQYHAVEPENRLVARVLERAWEEALLAQRTLAEEYDRFQQAQPLRLSAAERALIETLASDLPALWESSQASVPEKRQVIRLLLQRVVVWAPSTTPEVKVQLHWTGGTVTEHHLRRAVRSWAQMPAARELWQRVQGWHAAGWTSRAIAEELNSTGYRTPRDQPFHAASVRQLLSRGGPRVVPADPPGRRRRKHRPATAE